VHPLHGFSNTLTTLLGIVTPVLIYRNHASRISSGKISAGIRFIFPFLFKGNVPPWFQPWKQSQRNSVNSSPTILSGMSSRTRGWGGISVGTKFRGKLGTSITRKTPPFSPIKKVPTVCDQLIFLPLYSDIWNSVRPRICTTITNHPDAEVQSLTKIHPNEFHCQPTERTVGELLWPHVLFINATR